MDKQRQKGLTSTAEIMHMEDLDLQICASFVLPKDTESCYVFRMYIEVSHVPAALYINTKPRSGRHVGILWWGSLVHQHTCGVSRKIGAIDDSVYLNSSLA
jgi:hypothetical protein